MCATMYASERSGGVAASLQMRIPYRSVCAAEHIPSTTPTVPRVAHKDGMWKKMKRGVLIGAIFLAPAGGEVLGQEIVWRIPLAGAVEYERQGSARASDLCANRRAARRVVAESPMPSRYLHRLPPAPFVCQGELRDDQRALHRLPGMVADLRDAVRAVAFDLSGRGVDGRFPRLIPFGDVVLRGRWSTLSSSGSQRLDASFAAGPPRRLRGERPELSERLGAFCTRATSGRLVLRRELDVAAGVVVGFVGELDLVVEEGVREFRRLRIVERWQLVAVRENQDFDFRRRVAAAIRSGTDWVRTAIANDASFLKARRGERHYGSGRLALGLLALLHGDVAPQDEVVVAGFRELKRRRLDDAYSLATSLMAMSLLGRRVGLTGRDREVATGWLQKLLTCIDTRTDPSRRLRFNYRAGARHDTSLQQYGLLGLRAAQQIGLPMPPDVFAAAARHLLDVQGEASGSVELRLADGQQVQATLGTDGMPKGTRFRAKARGFAYQSQQEPAFGSMTSAGISGLLLAREGLVEVAAGGRKDRALIKQIDRAVIDGFGWLAENFSVRINPGFAERADNHWAYWLYCLERSCELRGVVRLQGRDWYYEGGLQLLSAQNGDGSFRSSHSSTLQLDSTCFAILFLTKASAPVPITGR